METCVVHNNLQHVGMAASPLARSTLSTAATRQMSPDATSPTRLFTGSGAGVACYISSRAAELNRQRTLLLSQVALTGAKLEKAELIAAKRRKKGLAATGAVTTSGDLVALQQPSQAGAPPETPMPSQAGNLRGMLASEVAKRREGQHLGTRKGRSLPMPQPILPGSAVARVREKELIRACEAYSTDAPTRLTRKDRAYGGCTF